ncbi:hypothetical protein [Sulfurivermis fontis]|jgi:hypothetical protein|uniref:hypothetical protein n=1 Tax=Sulfurivermis fontis TaxID=1972068 RepID=UPI000FDBBC18|nr:hypothetical protein [Sulfurivermis fontis]
MLQELPRVRQHGAEPRRRWFSDNEFDLIVWLDAEEAIIAFDLCYDKQRQEHVFRWRAAQGLSHLRVDDGEQRSGRHKMTPIYVTDGHFDAAAVARRFSAAAAAVPWGIRDFVLDRLEPPGSAAPRDRGS